jgi:hypothetical protein
MEVKTITVKNGTCLVHNSDKGQGLLHTHFQMISFPTSNTETIMISLKLMIIQG